MIEKYQDWVSKRIDEDDKEDFEKSCTHYIWKPIPGKEKYTGDCVKIRDSFGRTPPHVNKPSLKPYENEITINVLSSPHNSLKEIFHMSDEDVEKYFKPITKTYLSSKKFGM